MDLMLFVISNLIAIILCIYQLSVLEKYEENDRGHSVYWKKDAVVAEILLFVVNSLLMGVLISLGKIEGGPSYAIDVMVLVMAATFTYAFCYFKIEFDRETIAITSYGKLRKYQYSDVKKIVGTADRYVLSIGTEKYAIQSGNYKNAEILYQYVVISQGLKNLK